MVKRVLENKKYLCTDIYPQLISEGVFKAVNEHKTAKATSLGNQMAFKECKVRYNYKYLLGYHKGADGTPEIIPDEEEVIKLIFKK